MTVLDSFPLDELTTRVATELQRLALVQSNGQVSPVPDARTLRYYATLGLLDRPLEVRGRRSLYGPRHVLQAVAIKVLQADGLALQEIQQRLTGRSDDELRSFAPRPGGAGARFWRTPPTSAGPTTDDTSPVEPGAPSDSPAGADPLALSLAPGVILVIDTARPPGHHDLQAVRRASAPLLRELSRHGLLDLELDLDLDRNEQETT